MVDALLKDFDGSAVDLAALRGKVVLLDIWNFDCGSCRDSMPKKQAAYTKYREQGFMVLGLCIMEDESQLAANKAVLKKVGVTYPNLAVYGSLDQQQKALQDLGFDRTVGLYFLLDQDGKLVSADISCPWLDYEAGRLAMTRR